MADKNPRISLGYDVTGNAPRVLRAMAEALEKIDRYSKSVAQNLQGLNAGGQGGGGAASFGNQQSAYGALPPHHSQAALYGATGAYGPYPGYQQHGQSLRSSQQYGGYGPQLRSGPMDQYLTNRTKDEEKARAALQKERETKNRVLNSLSNQRRREEAKTAAEQKRDHAKAARDQARRDKMLMVTPAMAKKKGKGWHGGTTGSGALGHPRQAIFKAIFGEESGAKVAVGALISNYIARELAETGGRMAATAQNRDISYAQKRQTIAEDIPIIGGTIKAIRELAEAIEGTTERIRRSTLQAEINQAVGAGEDSFMGQALGMETQYHQLRGRARAFRNAPAVTELNRFDRTTFQGQIGYQENQIRVQRQDAEANARIEAQAASYARSDAESQSQQMERRYRGESGSLMATRNELEARRAEIMASENGRRARNAAVSGAAAGANLVGAAFPMAGGAATSLTTGMQVGGSSRRADRVDVENQLVEVNRRILALDEQRAAVSQRLGQSRIAEAQAVGNLRQATTDILQGELQILQAREQRQRGNLTRLGSMNAGERQMSVQAVEHFNRYGPEGTPSDLARMAQSVAPEFYQARAMQFAEQTPEARRLRQIGAWEPQSYRETTERMDDFQQRVREATRNNQAEMADRVANAFQETLELFVVRIEGRLETIRRGVVAGQRLQASLQGR